MAATKSHAVPSVSVIIPARNEEESLGTCLRSLVAQTGVDFEIIVVNDQSTDRKGEIAASFSGVGVVEAGPLPKGWSGKNHAVATGSSVARGEWLLFTDADTIHLPGSLARALDEARNRGADLLSYSPEQIISGFWEKAIMPLVFAELAAEYPPAEVSDPRSPKVAANGQYILIKREAYDAAGGHAAVAASLLEDVDLARAVKMSGRKVWFRYGGDAVRTRMYRSFAQLREGWTKNLVLLFPRPGRLAAVQLAVFGLGVSSAGALIGSLISRRVAEPRQGWFHSEGFLLTEAALLFLTGMYVLGRVRKGHFKLSATIPAFAGLPLFAYLLLRSKRAHKKGTVSWKGRMYGSGDPGVLSRSEPSGATA